jgi:hypothetical protein
MSKTLTLELSDELYATFQQQATAAGLSIEEWLLTSVQPSALPHNPPQEETLAHQDGISVDQFIAIAVAEKIAALTTETYLEERAKRGSRERYDALLAKVPDVKPEAYDQLPPSSN